MKAFTLRNITSGVCSALVAIAALCTVPTASAQEVRLERAGRGMVIIWKDKFNYQRGQRLVSEGAPFELQVPFMACVVAPRTKAFIIGDTGYFQTVLVAEGESKGCQGVVSRGDLGK